MRAGTETRDGKWEMGDNMGDLGICFCYLFIFKKGDN